MYDGKTRIGKHTIILARHGESTFNQKGIIQGQSDIATLTERGKAQAEAIGEMLRDINIDLCFYSPLKRVSQTAKIVCSRLRLPKSSIISEANLIEVDFGSWVGKPRIDVQHNFPDEYAIWRKRPFQLKIDDRYPVKELYDNLEAFVRKLDLTISQPKTILIIGHRGTVSGIVNILLGLPKSHHHFLQVDRGSISILRERYRDDCSIDFELLCANERPKRKGKDKVDFVTEERTKSKGEVFIVRHGQTPSNISKTYQGSQDISLSELGRRYIYELANGFQPIEPTRIFSSKLIRARESAKIIADSFNVSTIGQERKLHEYLYGVWEGMTESDVKKLRVDEYYTWQRSPEESEIPCAENIYDAYNRSGEVWSKYERDIDIWGGSIISVAHDIVNRLLICNALDLPSKYMWKFHQLNASVTVVSIKSNYDGRLRLLNHSSCPLSLRLQEKWL